MRGNWERGGGLRNFRGGKRKKRNIRTLENQRVRHPPDYALGAQISLQRCLA
jgi:hypothetical protein